MNLRMKLFAAFLVLIIVPMCLLGMVLLWIISDTTAEKYSQQAEYALKAISYNLTGVFEEMNKVTDNGIATSVFQMALNAKDPDKQDLGAADQLSLNASQRNFRSLLYNYPDISYAFLYNLNGRGPSSTVSIFTKENFKMMPYDQFIHHPLYGEVMDLNGVPKWIAPHEFPDLTGSDPVFTQIRLVKGLSYFDHIGILVVQIKNWQFDRIFRNLRMANSPQDTSFMLVNDNGLIVYDHTGHSSGRSLSEFTKNNLTYGQGYQSFKAPFAGQESMISIYHLKDYPWSLVSVTSWASLSGEYPVYAGWIGAFIVVCLFAAILFNMVFMNRITDSIAVMVQFMRRVEGGDLSARILPGGEHELRVLAVGFNDLMDKMGALFTRVKAEQEQKTRAELRVLQAQIKPHFLFNTLESINGLALRGEGRKVSEMVVRLAGMLRISIQEKEEITLAEEIRHLQNYLVIQQYRFEGLFQYTIDIEPSLRTCLLLKLTLQPLVENAIQHGFEGLSRPGELRISVWEENNNMVLEVKDNGMGISALTLEKFQYMMIEECEKGRTARPGKPAGERRGLGLRSVADRIRIQYGSRYGLFICSQPDAGTTIRCIIPKYEQEELK